MTPRKGPTPQTTITKLKSKRQKVLDLYCADGITSEFFGEQERQLTSQIKTLKTHLQEAVREERDKDEIADKFEQVAKLLSKTNFEIIWNEATQAECREFVDDLVGSICIYPDQLTVQVAGEPPILITLSEVSLRAGTRPVVG